jgi:hypothetical protein
MMVRHEERPVPLNNGDVLTGSVSCVSGTIRSGGYTVAVTRAGDLDKLIPFASFPSSTETWTVAVGASANVETATLTIFGVCQ